MNGTAIGCLWGDNGMLGCNTSRDCSFANNVQPDSESGLIDQPSSEVAFDPISVSEQQHRFVSLAAQADRDWPDAGRFPTRFVELDCAMFRGFERDQVPSSLELSAPIASLPITSLIELRI